MTDTPSTPPGQADDQSRPLDIPALRAAAELHMLDVLGVPSHLLPSGLGGHPLMALAVGLRKAALRRLRVADRLKVAAATIASQAVELIEVAGRRQTPAPGHPVSPADAARITELTAQLRELDLRLTDEAAMLIAAGLEYAHLHGPAATEPRADDAMPE